MKQGIKDIRDFEKACSKCHSFYTGMKKATRADERIDKFNKKYGRKS